MAFELPKLPYQPDALNPVISAKTLEFHYGKHHQTYVNNLNLLIPGTKFENMSLEQIVLESDAAVFNNAAQIWNHTFYFESFAPQASQKLSGKIEQLIIADFVSVAEFKDKFNKAAITLFGSGWAWLVINQSGKLEIVQESNAGNPMKKGMKPILTCDVWEHAYYIDYQNRRMDYVNAFWDIINWEKVNQRLS